MCFSSASQSQCSSTTEWSLFKLFTKNKNTNNMQIKQSDSVRSVSSSSNKDERMFTFPISVLGGKNISTISPLSPNDRDNNKENLTNKETSEKIEWSRTVPDEKALFNKSVINT